jgi:uncharacterized membrane protein
MKRSQLITLFLLLFIGLPVALAFAQKVPTQSTFQQVVLITSITAAGLAFGAFWLTRLIPFKTSEIRMGKVLLWHKYIGYTVGAVFLLHPFLIIARRFWAIESNPIDNLKLLFSSPLVWPGVAAWVLLIVMLSTAFFRNRFTASTFRALHGCLAVGFVLLATWHIVSIGRHSDIIFAAFWILIATAAIATYFTRIFKKRTHS